LTPSEHHKKIDLLPPKGSVAWRRLIFDLAKGKFDPATASLLQEQWDEFTTDRVVQDTVARLTRNRLRVEMAPACFEVLFRVAKNEDIAPRVRVDAAKAILDRAGYPAGKPDEGKAKAIEDMSEGELKEWIAAMKGRLGDNAPKTIDAEPQPIEKAKTSAPS